MPIDSIGSPAVWAGFAVIVVVMLGLDLGVFHRRAHEIRMREALVWTLVWIALALLFNIGVYARFGANRALEFFTGYLIEKALSVDNIFVFLVLLSAFAVPPALQHRVLFWGVAGALVMRGAFVFAGAALLQSFHWVIYVFGAFLVFTGVKLLLQNGTVERPGPNPLFRAFTRVVPAVSDYRGSRFTVLEKGRRCATPLLLVVAAIETTDIVFAVDSIPAVFAVTTDPFIVYTSNIFAILGLRALYFVLAGVINQFRYLKHGLALVLLFVGAKMTVSPIFKIPVEISLVVIAALLGGSIFFSLARTREAARILTPGVIPTGKQPRGAL